ncbi:hypothetical protein CDL15_Pgr011461 [Punica granatum]|uniref:Uncharacterized protein n=1 Tax=Punica granatum TaxID=22663 RepID=A0A218WH38_PUNGR|nr:hypothetical protein CDL15_Pgr011461 [Punica granatum]PKI73118.1 hypothetical protein CRG98_006526 [Punica granatum]
MFEFEEGEKACLLPKCGYSFHIESVVQSPKAKSKLERPFPSLIPIQALAFARIRNLIKALVFVSVSISNASNRRLIEALLM